MKQFLLKKKQPQGLAAIYNSIISSKNKLILLIPNFLLIGQSIANKTTNMLS